MANRKTPQVADIFAASKAARATRRPEPVPESVSAPEADPAEPTSAKSASPKPPAEKATPREAAPREAAPKTAPSRKAPSKKRLAPKAEPSSRARSRPTAEKEAARTGSEPSSSAPRSRTRMGAWKDPNRQKTTILVDKDLMLRVKIRALREERELWQIVEGLLEAYIDDRLDPEELDLDRRVDF